MTTLEETPQDWSELSLKAQKLQKQRDQLLNDGKYDEAYLIHIRQMVVNNKLEVLINDKLD